MVKVKHENDRDNWGDKKMKHLLYKRYNKEPTVGDYQKLQKQGKLSKGLKFTLNKHEATLTKFLNQFYSKFGTDCLFNYLDNFVPERIEYNTQMKEDKGTGSKDKKD